MALSRFELSSLSEVDKLTLTEFHCLSHARNEQDVYREYLMHKQAFVSREVNATKNVGSKNKPKEEYVYKQFDKFFDYEKALDDVRNFNRERKKNDSDAPSQKDIANKIAEFNKRKQ